MIKSKLMLLLIISVMSCFQLFNFDPAWGQSKSQLSSSDTMKDDTAAMPTITTLQSLIRSMQDLESQLKDLKPALKAAETEEQKIKKEAGASSLDFEILADFSGKAAQYHNVLARAIQRIAVDACNKYGWVIPFTQLTRHTAKE